MIFLTVSLASFLRVKLTVNDCVNIEITLTTCVHWSFVFIKDASVFLCASLKQMWMHQSTQDLLFCIQNSDEGFALVEFDVSFIFLLFENSIFRSATDESGNL